MDFRYIMINLYDSKNRFSFKKNYCIAKNINIEKAE